MPRVEVSGKTYWDRVRLLLKLWMRKVEFIFRFSPETLVKMRKRSKSCPCLENRYRQRKRTYSNACNDDYLTVSSKRPCTEEVSCKRFKRSANNQNCRTDMANEEVRAWCYPRAEKLSCTYVVESSSCILGWSQNFCLFWANVDPNCSQCSHLYSSNN